MQNLSFLDDLITKKWSVTEITSYIKRKFDDDVTLQDIWVQGEISNYKKYSSGHAYFSVKDQDTVMRGVMWRGSVSIQRYLPSEGDKVEVHGYISVYPQRGEYQIYADIFQPLGEGDLHREFILLKAKLEAEGLFDPAIKKQLPEQPKTIGLVTSPSGAAVQDVLTTLQRRYPLINVVLAPSLVQGEKAPKEIIESLRALSQRDDIDVIILCRGGGSLEDLWAFNDEELAREIAALDIPIITGVGHETDFTIADFVSDVRAATPTAAAELAVPDKSELLYSIENSLQDLSSLIQSYHSELRDTLRDQMVKLERLSPRELITLNYQRVDNLHAKITSTLSHFTQMRNTKLAHTIQQLNYLNPLAILDRGYAVVTGENGQVIKHAEKTFIGEELTIKVHEGEIGAEVTKTTK